MPGANQSMDDKLLSLYAVCPPGLESVLFQELRGIGVYSTRTTEANLAVPIPVELGSGGIEFDGTLNDLYRANLHLRCASRILLRLGSFHASKFVELTRKTGNLDWQKYITNQHPLAFRVTAHRSRLYHSGAVAERIAAGIAERVGFQPVVEKYREDIHAAQLIVVRLLENECTISLDASGAPLHQRGYRQALAKAPLRETIAAGMLLASGWDQRSPLMDPFCGSGVIPIEGAWIAARIPPGYLRKFIFMDWPEYDAAAWKCLIDAVKNEIQTPVGAILGSDRDAGAVKMAAENAERAGAASWVNFSRRAVSDIEPSARRGWVVTNPPYGLRISRNQDLRNLYAQFGNVLRERCPGWQVAFLCNDDRLATQTGLIFREGISLVSGGLPIKLNRSVVPEKLT